MNIDYLIKFHRDKLTECDRCGNLELHMETLLRPWRRVELINICSKCAPKANSFFGYYGKKNPKHIRSLMEYLTTGSKQQEKLTAMMNAGYFSDQPHKYKRPI